ncbi:hypothetical protein TNCV_3315771 [Trichonephila clavipes]|nr:hypothetical protein TNCV_3315771 [Trichonephila clavipes]
MVKTSTTPEMAPPLLTTTPHQREDVSTHLTCIAALHCGSLLILGLNKASHDPIPIPLGYRDHVYMLIRYQTDKRARRGLLVTDHGQVTSTTPEMAPPLLTTTPHQREDVSSHLTYIAALHCGSLLILGLNKASHDPIPIPLGYRDHVYMLIRYQTDKRARR